MSEIYEITLEKEVLREMAASIEADYSSYIINNGIDKNDLSNPVVMMSSDITNIKNRIIPTYNTKEDLKIAEGKLRQLMAFIENIKGGYNEKRAI
jgi:hypothetical protein